MIVELGQPNAGFAVHMPGTSVGLNYVCDTQSQAERLADAHERQHGIRPAITPVVVRIDAAR